MKIQEAIDILSNLHGNSEKLTTAEQEAIHVAIEIMQRLEEQKPRGRDVLE